MSIVNAKQQQQHSVENTEFYSHNNFLQEFCEIIFVIRRIKLEILITFLKCESEIMFFPHCEVAADGFNFVG